MTINEMIEMLQSDRTLKTITYYLSPKNVIRVTANHKFSKRITRSRTYSVSTGQPNYLARAFIKKTKTEPFPKVQTNKWPVKRKVKK